MQLPSIDDIGRSSPKRVVVCRGRSCCKYGAKKVLANFKQQLSSDVELIAVPCLGQCGCGAMVLIEPAGNWYSQVHPSEVAIIIEQDVISNLPVKAMLYPKFHPAR